MKLLALAVAAILAIVLQGTFLRPLGLPLDLALLVTLATAWWRGRTSATVLGLWCGALVGAMSGTSLAFAGLYGLLGWCSATLLRMHSQRGPVRAALLAAAAAASFQGLENLLWVVAQHRLRVEPGLLLAGMLWNGLCMGLLVWLSQPRRMQRRMAWTGDWQLYGG